MSWLIKNSSDGCCMSDNCSYYWEYKCLYPCKYNNYGYHMFDCEEDLCPCRVDIGETEEVTEL